MTSKCISCGKTLAHPSLGDRCFLCRSAHESQLPTIVLTEQGPYSAEVRYECPEEGSGTINIYDDGTMGFEFDNPVMDCIPNAAVYRAVEWAKEKFKND